MERSELFRRYQKGPRCPRCGSTEVTDTIDGFFICEECNHIFNDLFRVKDDEKED